MVFDHINISAPREKMLAVKDFYCDVFDLTAGHRPSFEHDGYWLYHEGTAIVHLVEDSERNALATKSYLDHMAFRVKGIETVLARLSALDIPYDARYREDLDMSRVFFYDPVGLRIELNFVGEPLPA